MKVLPFALAGAVFAVVVDARDVGELAGCFVHECVAVFGGDEDLVVYACDVGGDAGREYVSMAYCPSCSSLS